MRPLPSAIAILTSLGILLTAACGPAPTPAPTARLGGGEIGS